MLKTKNENNKKKKKENIVKITDTRPLHLRETLCQCNKENGVEITDIRLLNPKERLRWYNSRD